MVREISPGEFVARRDSGADPLLLDVREDWEVGIANVPGTLHIPMGQIVGRLGELDRAREIVVMCRSGGRSLRVAQYLEQSGFKSVANLSGGILAWSRELDPSIPEY